MKPKQNQQLPKRGVLRDLAQGPDKPGSTISDYAKATPIAPRQPTPTIVQNLRPVKGK
jgi:hypothetical protein